MSRNQGATWNLSDKRLKQGARRDPQLFPVSSDAEQGAAWLPTRHKRIGAFVRTPTVVPPSATAIPVSGTPAYLSTNNLVNVTHFANNSGNTLHIVGPAGNLAQTVHTHTLVNGAGQISYDFDNLGGLQYGSNYAAVFNAGEASFAFTPQPRAGYSYVNLSASFNTTAGQGLAFGLGLIFGTQYQLEYQNLGPAAAPNPFVIQVDNLSQVIGAPEYAGLANPDGSPATFAVYVLNLFTNVWSGPTTFALTPTGAPYVPSGTGGVPSTGINVLKMAMRRKKEVS